MNNVTVREYFAINTLIPLIEKYSESETPQELTDKAVQYADSLIASLKNKPENP